MGAPSRSSPTAFSDDGDLALASQRRVIDFVVDAGVNGICILANYSEQFSLTDDERDRLLHLCIQQVAGRVPVIVTTSHFSSRVAAERSRRAQEAGAAMVMLMPPYHGVSFRADDVGVEEYFQTVADAVDIPLMIQDAPLRGVSLSAAFLVHLAKTIPQVQYAKIETPGAATKLRAVIEQAGGALPGPFDTEESITLIPDLDAGATGTMPSAIIPESLRQVMDRYRGGEAERGNPLILRGTR